MKFTMNKYLNAIVTITLFPCWSCGSGYNIVYLVLDKFSEAFADYDTSITLRIFKKNLASFIGAGYAALKKKDWTRAKRYFDYLVECRPDQPNSYDCLGDYYLAFGDTVNAVKTFKMALEKDPTFSPSADKVRKLK